MVRCLNNDIAADRKPLIHHQNIEMLRQCFFGILAGYEYCNDHDALRSEPVTVRLAGNWPWWLIYRAVARRAIESGFPINFPMHLCGP